MVKEMNVTAKTRFAYLDNIRSLAIFFVIFIHAAVTYSGMGGWYYVEGSAENLSIFEMVFFGFFQSFFQAWLMGILFFISAYLATKALAKHGSLKFIKERFFRLGLPLLIYVFIVSPFIIFCSIRYYSENSFLYNYINIFIKDSWWIGSTGPLWYVQVLLILCVIYTIIKIFISKSIKLNNVGSIHIIFAILFTTIIAFFIRAYIPIGSSFFNLQFAYFPSYIVMFIAGIIIGENNLLDSITNERNIKWLKLTLLIGTPLWAAIMLFGGALEGKEYYNGGGFYWQNFAFALWESFTAIGISVGLMAFFKNKVNIDNKFTQLTRDNAFGVYFFHAPILIAVSLVIKNIALNPILKFSIALIAAAVLCLLFSFIVRKIKPIGILLK